jgi:hypothetical protein
MDTPNVRIRMHDVISTNSTCSTRTAGDIRTAQQEDPVIVQVIEHLNKTQGEAGSEEKWKQNGELKRYRQLWTQLIMLDGILHRRVDQGTQEERTVLVVPRKMPTDLLKLAHDDPSSGHMGINRCVERLQQNYYWPGIASEVQLWVAECEQCNRRKTPAVTARAPRKSIEVGKPMELWAMDILGPLPITARGNQFVLVMSDHFSKWVEAVPLPNQRAETVARAFVDEVIARHGVPTKLITDQGRNFEADLMKKVFAKFWV